VRGGKGWCGAKGKGGGEVASWLDNKVSQGLLGMGAGGLRGVGGGGGAGL